MSTLRGASLRMYNDMDAEELEAFSSTRHAGIPHQTSEGDVVSGSHELDTKQNKSDGAQDAVSIDDPLEKARMRFEHHGFGDTTRNTISVNERDNAWITKNRNAQYDRVQGMTDASESDDTTYGQVHINGVSNYSQSKVTSALKKHKFTVLQFAGAFIDIKSTKRGINKKKVKEDIRKAIEDTIVGSTVGVNIF